MVLSYAGSGVSQVTRTVQIAAGESQLAGAEELPFDTIETYDRHGRLHSVAEPSGMDGALVTTTYTYDAGNRLTKASMSDGTTTQERLFTYDGRGFLLSEKHPEKGASGNGTVTYPEYDARGHALERVDGSNHLVFEYDRAERLLSVTEDRPAPLSDRKLKEFVYGTSGISEGKLVSATRHNHLAEFSNNDLQVREIYTYGADGRVSKRQTERTDFDSAGGTIFGPEIWFETEFSWTDLGDLDTVTYPACKIAKNSECTPNDLSGAPARTITHGYTNGFLTSVGGFASSITYHPNEMIASVVHSNGVTDLFELDPNSMRRPARIRTTGVPSGSNFDTGTYTYDGAGNVKEIGDRSYTYDGVSRLVQGTETQVIMGQPVEVLTDASVYDAFGNRVWAQTEAVGARPIHVSPSTNRLLGSPSRPVEYNDRGSQTLWGTAVYTYDAADQMATHVDPSAGIGLSFVYTADDERIVVIENSIPRENWFLRDLDGSVLREFQRIEGDTDWQEDTIHRQGQVLGSESVTAGVRHAHLDHLGTPRLWTGPLFQGSVSPSHHTYSAFGEEIPDNFLDSDLRFTGHERDVARSGGCTGTTTVDNQTLSTGQTITGCDELTSSNTTITSPDEVRFQVGDVIRLEEFSVAAGAVFAAEVNGDLNSDLQDLDYMHARFCSPTLGRFLSPDLVGGDPVLPQSWNRFSYVLNNPMKYVDPTGLVVECFVRTGDNGEEENVCVESEPVEVVDTAPKFNPLTGVQGLGDLITGGFSLGSFAIEDSLIRGEGGSPGDAGGDQAEFTGCSVFDSTGQCLAKCAADELGLTFAGGAVTLSSLRLVPTRAKLGGAKPGTSIASVAMRKVFPQRLGTRLFFGTNVLGGVIGRAAGPVGAGLLGASAINIAGCASR